MGTDFLDWALADFSGYVAADELYDAHSPELRGSASQPLIESRLR